MGSETARLPPAEQADGDSTVEPLLFAARLNLFGISLSALWDPLNSLVLPRMVSAVSREALRGSALGMVTFVGIGAAVLVQPVAGALNDTARISNRRKRFILPGGVVMLLALLALAFASSIWWLLVAYLALQIAANVAQAAFQALIPDHVPPDDRAPASGVKTAFGMLGTLLGLGSAALILLFGGGERLVVAVLAGFILLGVLGVWRLLPWNPPPSRGRLTASAGSTVIEAFAPLVKGTTAFKLTLLTRFLFLLGLYPLQRFLLYFLEDHFRLNDPVTAASLALFVAVLIGALAAALVGVAAKRVDRLRLTRAAVVISAVGVTTIGLLPPLWTVASAGILIAVGAGAFQALNWADIADQIPEGQGAKYFGVANITTAGASATAGLLGPLVDAVRSFAPSGTYSVTFLLAAVATLLALVPIQLRGRAAAKVAGSSSPACSAP